MSDNEKRPQNQEAETEEESASASAASAGLPDTETSEGDPPIIIQGGGSGNPG